MSRPVITSMGITPTCTTMPATSLSLSGEYTYAPTITPSEMWMARRVPRVLFGDIGAEPTGKPAPGFAPGGR
jgi:hypothetical protein